MPVTLQHQLRAAVVEFQEEKIQHLIQQSLASGMSPQEIVSQGLVPGLEEVGRLYSQGAYFLPELAMCSSTTQKAMDILDPLLSQGDRGNQSRIVMGTVAGDFHNIGKNMVISTLRGAGYEVLDFGIDVATDRFIEAVKETKPDILGLSALLLTTREMMQDVIESLVEANLRDQVKVIIGGCAVDQGFANAIGADGYGEDAVSALNLARRLIS